MKTIIAIDPGKTGGIAVYKENNYKIFEMPLDVEGCVCFDSLYEILETYSWDSSYVFLERAVAFKMGCKSAFNYGYDFCTIRNVTKVLEFSITLVEPKKWTKEIHAGIDSKKKAKQKSLIALHRLLPKDLIATIPTTPRSKKIHDGIIDALLIAEYGKRFLNLNSK